MTIDTKIVDHSSSSQERRRDSNPFDSAPSVTTESTERSPLLGSYVTQLSARGSRLQNSHDTHLDSADEMGHDIAPPSYQAVASSDLDEEHGLVHPEVCPYSDGPQARAWWKRQRRLRRRRKAHACCAKCVKLFLFTSAAVLFGLLLGSIFWEADKGHPYQPAPSPPAQDGTIVKRPQWSDPHEVPAGKRPIHNGEKNVDVWFTETDFELDADASQLWFHAYGRHVNGDVLVGRSGNTKNNKVRVSVQAVYSDQRLFDSITIAKMSDKAVNGQGIGIYEADGSRDRNFMEEVYFSVSYLLPNAPAGRAPLKVSNMSTIVHNMAISTDSLDRDGGLIFGDWTASSKNGHITLESVTATKSVSVKSDNGAITAGHVSSPVFVAHSDNGHMSLGLLDVSESVKLTCNNGRIDALDVRTPQVIASSHNGRIGGSFNVSRSLVLQTSTGSISARVRVLNPPKDVEDEGVTVRAATEAGRVELVYVDHPEGIKLASTASSQVGSITVEHPATYQGQVSARTNIGRITMDGPGNQKGREFRTDNFDGRLGHKRVDGRTWWKRNARNPGSGEKGGNEDNVKGWGSSTASTSAGKVHLIIN